MIRMISRLIQSIDWLLLIPVVLLGVVSYFSISSATGFQGPSRAQFLYFCFGLGVALFISRFSVWIYFRSSFVVYMLVLIALVAVLMLGTQAGGSQRWLAIGGFRIQPSEVMKIALILYLARVLQAIEPFERIGLKKLLRPLGIVLLPALCVLVEPDLGTALVLLAIGLMMVLLCHVDRKLIAFAVLLGIIAAPVSYFFVLKDYQRQRVISFLDPNSDPQGAGYNAIQSMIAIGSGQISGKGYAKGTQSRLDFIPEQHTDFIFSAFSEEWGFLGVIALLMLYMMLFLRLYKLASHGPTPFATLFCLGYCLTLSLQVGLNIGMVCGLLPVVGLALPFMSYGGSSLMANFMALGVCMGIKRQQLMFRS
jgi:rod shape determining protein RodA